VNASPSVACLSASPRSVWPTDRSLFFFNAAVSLVLLPTCSVSSSRMRGCSLITRCGPIRRMTDEVFAALSPQFTKT